MMSKTLGLVAYGKKAKQQQKEEQNENTIHGWLVKNMHKYKDRGDLITACAKANRVQEHSVKSALSRINPLCNQFSKYNGSKYTKDMNGVKGFRSRFSKPDIALNKLRNGIETLLKKRGWMYDLDFRMELGIDSNSWTILRREHENLLVSVREEGKTKTVWCHPSIVDECREYASRRLL